MLTFIITQIFSFIGGGGVSIVSKWINSKNDQNLQKIKSDTDIELARISAENSKYVQENNIKIIEANLDAETEKRVLELERLFKKSSGNKYIDTINAIVRPAMTAFIIFFIFPKYCDMYYQIYPEYVFVFICTIVTSITGYWFVNRNFMKNKQKED